MSDGGKNGRNNYHCRQLPWIDGFACDWLRKRWLAFLWASAVLEEAVQVGRSCFHEPVRFLWDNPVEFALRLGTIKLTVHTDIEENANLGTSWNFLNELLIRIAPTWEPELLEWDTYANTFRYHDQFNIAYDWHATQFAKLARAEG